MKKITLLFLAAAALPLLAAGCATRAHYIETGGHESVVTVNSINIQDFIQAANAATSDLLASGALDRVPNPPAVLAISRIVNNTGQQIDTDLLVKKIRVAVLNSGKAQTTTTLGLNKDAVEDPMAKGLKDEADFKSDSQNTRTPDFTLSGKIIQTIARDGNTSQSTFSFQLSLTDSKTGLAVWEGEKEITKQGGRPSVGF
jgi:penicillin-binding protein activator